MLNRSVGNFRRALVSACAVLLLVSQSGCIYAMRDVYSFKYLATIICPGTIINKGRPTHPRYHHMRPSPQANYGDYMPTVEGQKVEELPSPPPPEPIVP